MSQFNFFNKEEWNHEKCYIEQWIFSRSFRTSAFSHQEDLTHVENLWQTGSKKNLLQNYYHVIRGGLQQDRVLSENWNKVLVHKTVNNNLKNKTNQAK